MQRQTLAALGLLVVLGVVLALVLQSRSKAEIAYAPASASAPPSASAPAPAPAPSALAELPPTEAPEALPGAAGFDLLPDGRSVPDLPADAPKSVGFGVVLFTYVGAQAAPPGARSKQAAKERADAIVADATRDFKAAVSKGDRGSTPDAGRVPRGVLEPAVEYVLFTLAKGSVHPQPVDTPRGYWVVRRND